MDSNLRFKKHITNCIGKAYSRALLKLIYAHKGKQSLILSHFNFCDIVYHACIDQADIKRIQKVQNACLRLRRGHHVIHKIKETIWLSMTNRCKLHSICTYYNILTTKEPSSLYNKVLFRCDVHV
nr:unnamed protein product [Callosobruchus chinensis]